MWGGVINELHPHIITGDFNSEIDMERSLTMLARYPLYRDLGAEQKKLFERYYTSHLPILRAQGYLPGFNPSSMGSATSIYGGTPDQLFYQGAALAPLGASVLPFLDESDHNAVMMRFEVFTDRKIAL